MLIRVNTFHILTASAFVLFFIFSSWRRHERHQGACASNKTHVLILSTWRSGSTLAGQLFSQNSEVFYLMEPAKHVWNRMPWGSPELLQGPLRDLLRSIFLCDMTALCSYIEQPSKVYHLFMWSMSRALCSPPACEAFSRSDIIDTVNCNARCGHSAIEKISEACTTYSHVVVKTVRFFQLEALYPLLTDPSLNVHVIHLVRDPRAVYASRQTISLFPDDLLISNAINVTPSTQVVMRKVCHSQVGMYLTAMNQMPPALRKRYLLTRYEDLVRDPIRKLAEWYKFTGLTSSRKLEAWIYNITHWPASNTDKSDVDPVGIQKNANMVSQAWRKHLHFQDVKEVQNICQLAMKVFGYRQVGSELEQRDLMLDLVLPQKKT
ncbi:carbohydrate sulfotransferase 5-like [Sphaerodactylus townsendi]|uniref:carbohydrate sulfotransferase 5-like n=1 Tax=Sphaerodactylus townsendi TaxID=933632 RepID=UPI002026D190|nr:carbohydrate sulfotransferase 5-like [Sphaerodactylus townsendi]